MQNVKTDLKELIEGDVSDNSELRDLYSHDASMFELRPELVVAPKNSKDIEKIVKYIAQKKKTIPIFL